MVFSVGYVRDLRQKVGQEPLIVVGSAAVVRRHQQLLLIKRTDNLLWGLPAGSKELNESAEDTARRELREEAGLIATDAKLMTVASGSGMQYTYPNGDSIDSVTVVYALTVTGEAQPDNIETSSAKFFDLQQLPENLTPLTRQILQEISLIN